MQVSELNAHWATVCEARATKKCLGSIRIVWKYKDVVSVFGAFAGDPGSVPEGFSSDSTRFRIL